MAAGALRPRQWLRWFAGLVLFALIGLVAFVATLPRVAAGREIAPADGIVALTGDNGRLIPAVELLEKNKGARLLITGVYPKTTKEKLKTLTQGGERFDCCADLGFEATSTRGNAREAASWVNAHRYKSLIVVTADYHMPRSLLEFRAAMPDVRMEPYAVADDARPTLLHAWRRWSEEYGKYIAAYLRIAASRLMPPA
jgi:uncharacterized SAM-binding protein YcdF (DUF218 family)